MENLSNLQNFFIDPPLLLSCPHDLKSHLCLKTANPFRCAKQLCKRISLSFAKVPKSTDNSNSRRMCRVRPSHYLSCSRKAVPLLLKSALWILQTSTSSMILLPNLPTTLLRCMTQGPLFQKPISGLGNNHSRTPGVNAAAGVIFPTSSTRSTPTRPSAITALTKLTTLQVSSHAIPTQFSGGNDYTPDDVTQDDINLDMDAHHQSFPTKIPLRTEMVSQESAPERTFPQQHLAFNTTTGHESPKYRISNHDLPPVMQKYAQLCDFCPLETDPSPHRLNRCFLTPNGKHRHVLSGPRLDQQPPTPLQLRSHRAHDLYNAMRAYSQRPEKQLSQAQRDARVRFDDLYWQNCGRPDKRHELTEDLM